MIDFDYIVVGGGSAGCVLANRLSARSANRVLLLEAGQNIVPGAVPAEIEDSYPGAVFVDPRYNWSALRVSTRRVGNDTGRPLSDADYRFYIQARVLGGGSTINGQFANRGSPADYDEWVARGADGWGWDEVLPYFRRLETDLDFAGPYHGKDGPITIRRLPRKHWTGHAKAVAAALEAMGHKYVEDQNGAFEEGYYSNAMSNSDEVRCSAATGYLSADVRKRPNLTIRTEANVLRLVFDGQVCTGVEVRHAGREEVIGAREVIVSSGAIMSPALLLRSGIGPEADLRPLGIAVVANRPGVGARLMDHPSVALGTFLKPYARMNRHTRRHMHIGLRYSSGIGTDPADMWFAVISKTAWHAVGEQIGAFAVLVNKTYSETGRVRLKDADPLSVPIADFELLSDYRDMERLKQGMHFALRVAQRPEMRDVISDVFPASYADRVLQFGAVTARNRRITRLASWLLDGPSLLRRYILAKEVIKEFPLEETMGNEERLETFIRKAVIGAFHASCSCRMGAPGDVMSVVDSRGRVHGVAGLRICDSSIFPAIPRANINVPTMMVAEKISDHMLLGE